MVNSGKQTGSRKQADTDNQSGSGKLAQGVKGSGLGAGACSKSLEQRIGYQFKNKQLLRSALTHSSSQVSGKTISGTRAVVRTETQSKRSSKNGDADNERLEFLGDRVLGLSISAALIALYPDSPEGDLARRYNSLVRRRTCAEIAQDIELGSYLILSAGEDRSGGRAKSTILANGMEALLGAIFLDGGYAAADKMICEFWREKISQGEEVALDAKTALQEWAQGSGFDLPIYNHISRTGPDHSPEFVVEVIVKGVGAGRGQGLSKRIAEQMAASALLEIQNVRDDDTA